MTTTTLSIDLDTLWILFCAILVTTMQAGFCCLESGLVRAKNSINVAIKNLVDFCISSAIFWAIGFQLMFGDSWGGWIGWQLWLPDGWTTQTYAFFLFQLVFCGTSTTIVSGAVAERMTFGGYFWVAMILSGLVYPITGHWVWGGYFAETTSGWLANLDFHDFAGATVVHSVGGWVSLASIITIGPRIGRFGQGEGGHSSGLAGKAIEGHNLPISVLGVFLLWFGWFGFNGGSTLGMTETVPQILVNTALGGAVGGLTALVATWMSDKQPRVQIIMNGVIGGLVSVTAGCDQMTSMGAVIAAGIGGILCTYADWWLSQAKIDDAIGAVPAHLVCGIWGTFAAALLSTSGPWAAQHSLLYRLGVQSLGILAVGLYAFGISMLMLLALKQVLPLRVTAEEERIGLNISEHGASTSTQDLLTSMNAHSMAGDFSQPVFVEPETEVSPIAAHYNRVLQKVNEVTKELVESRERLLTILNSQAFPVVISDPATGKLKYINQRAAQLFGFTLPEAGRYTEMDFWEQLSTRETFLKSITFEHPKFDFEARLRKVSGQYFWSLISGIKLLYDGELSVLYSFNDISNRKTMEIQLKHLAERDPLTGCLNRRSFFERALQLVEQVRLDEKPISVFILDIDRFKLVNDTYGHPVGDEVIRAVAEIDMNAFRDQDIWARIGGEEFAGCLPGLTALGAQGVAERLRHQVEMMETLTQAGIPLQVTVSIGLAEVNPNQTLAQAMSQADQGLYRAKQGGRNQVMC
ncbi:MAG: ammonium transporter [Synechococcaceae cyanobacterium SM2_3_2]|nr:ammonium transporter [Synechococcaceae cyanobacterium SM2_3_2]